jgi:hypothetical protein
MSRTISFSDLLYTVPELQGRTEADLLHPSMDEFMIDVLQDLGFSVDIGVEYKACKHRNLRNQVVTGFTAIGCIAKKGGYVKSKFCTPIERITRVILHGDLSLGRELMSMQGLSFNMRSIMKPEDGVCDEEFPEEDVSSDYTEVMEQIAQLEAYKRLVRQGVDNGSYDLR